MTTKSWQRSWVLRIGHNASIGQGWKARLQVVTHIRDTEPWQTSGTALCLDSPPPPAWKDSEIGNTAYISRLNMYYLYGLSIPPDWYCEGAVIDEGTACLCPRGSIGECICFRPPDIHIYTWGKSHVVNKLRPRERSLTLTGFTKQRCYRHLSQEVLLRVMVKRRHCTCGPKPCVYCNIVFISFTKAAIIREADVFLQLWYLRQHQNKQNSIKGIYN